ncbi:MAG: hypothetical protein GJ680_18725 [Alteromonadaceae bacterium]|nr:hypothetical protein [Alteromonadaceae bacterium]
MNLEQIKRRVGAFKFYVTLIVVLSVCGYAGYSVGVRYQANLQQEIAQLTHSVENLREENNKLTRSLNILGVDLEVSRLANENSQQLIRDEMQEQVALRKELSFYQKVMAPEMEQEGFYIDSFNVEPTSSANYYRFALILMQQERRRSQVKGTLNIKLVGSQAGERKALDLSKLLSESSDNFAFSFKYFEIVRGEFTLPVDFLPEQVQVESKLKNAKWGKRDLARTFEWQLPLEVGTLAANQLN